MNGVAQSVIEAATLGSISLVAYHHAGYPLLLRALRKPTAVPAALARDDLPSMTIVMPAYNEAGFIVRKIRNLADLDYPPGRLKLIIMSDGCTDNTVALCHTTIAEPCCAHLDVTVIDNIENRGKVAVVNQGVAMADGDIVVFTDVSAMLPEDALLRVGAHFADPGLGAVGGTYRLQQLGSDGEGAYWAMQLGVKRGEAALGAPLGLHGAFYAVRRSAWTSLQPDTINDDFIVPMKIFGQGWRVAYDDQIVAVELERTTSAMEMRRRQRIAAGNTQQLIRLASLLRPTNGGVAFAFASGKALRVIMPLLIIASLLGSFALMEASPVFTVLAGLQVVGLMAAALGGVMQENAPKPLAIALYLVAGHLVSLGGVWRYLTGYYSQPWQRATAVYTSPAQHVPATVAFTKRVFDVAVASIGLIVTAPLWPLVALAIKVNSPGPVLFRQSRIGRVLPDRAEIFQMIKFRSMYIDAEARSGAVWATQDDPRITPVGRFLRKVRVDEIPQLVNVLLGDMSIVGPRPERPGFYARLEKAIPFFADRTDGLRPGITGLAQVNQGYDTNLDDVRRKVAFDHAYGMRLVDMWSWLSSDIRIMFQTVAVMATGRGQ